MVRVGIHRHRHDARLNALDRVARSIMRGHERGGILAVFHLIVRFDPSSAIGVPGQAPVRNYGPIARRIVGADILRGVFSRPQHAVSVYRHRRRVEPVIENAPGRNAFDEIHEYDEYRFFWGSWA